MTRKRTNENDLAVPGGAAPRARRATPVKRAKHSTVTAETSQAIAAPVAQATIVSAPSQEEIARLAYLYWEERGCQGGSSEEDWLRAERELRSRATVATA
ncbi:MAG TPA: DUF2934 domain-containing protein [Bryobacteraceae bacterium]|nr:DUF2934 domain-containing protein [Bryobacteraceae bacterium]